MDCPVFKTWFFRPVSTGNSSSAKALKVLSILYCIFAFLFLGLAVRLLYKAVKGNKGSRPLISRLVEKLKPSSDGNDNGERGGYRAELLRTLDEGSGSKRGKFWRALMHLVMILGGGVMIAAVEKTIALNDIDLSEGEFGDAGQLIPFFIGLFTIISTLWSLCFDRDNAEDTHTNSGQEQGEQQANDLGRNSGQGQEKQCVTTGDSPV